MRIQLEAPAKLTLSLRVTGIRDDGYHLIRAEMVSLDIFDSLSLDPEGSEFVVINQGKSTQGEQDDCVAGGRAEVSGIGEVLTPLEHVNQTFTLYTPAMHCSTPVVYQVWDSLGGPVGENGNDLEPAALHAYPALAEHRDFLGSATGQQPRLAGSGSTWFVEGAYEGPGLVIAHTLAPQ